MSIAYKWFSKYPEDQLQHFKIVVCGPAIYFHFKFAAELFLQKSIRRAPSARYLIMYIENGSSTQVICPERNIQVEESMIQVFCEDFKEFLINRRTILESLDMRGLVDERTIYDRIFECMESAFKERSEKLQVKSVRFDIFYPKQVIELLQFINPEALTNINFYFGDTKDLNIKYSFETGTFDDKINYLIKWNRGCRLNVLLECVDLTTEKLTSFKRILNYPAVFKRIRLEYTKKEGFEKEQLIAFFNPFLPIQNQNDCNEDYIEFELQEPREALTKETACLGLQDIRSLEVFANPLLMEMILEKIDHFDVQSLRKVSRDIRSCIDTLKPDPRIEVYEIKRSEIYVETSEIKAKNNLDLFRLETHIILKNGSEKCIKHPERELGIDYYVYEHMDTFGDDDEIVVDFKTNILHQKSKMNRLHLDSHGNLLELIGNVLKSRDKPLSVRKLRMGVEERSDIMNILPYLDSIEEIHIFRMFNYSWLLSDVFELDQWKKAFKVEIKHCIVENSIQKMNITNFKEVDITLFRLTSNDVIYLKENIIKSANFNKFKIEFPLSSFDDSLYTSMPPYQRVPDVRSVWFFPLPILNKFLHIFLHENKKLILFTCVDRDSVPEDFFE